MLRLNANTRLLRIKSKCLGYPKNFSVIRNNEIIVSEPKNLAHVALRLYDQHELAAQLVLLNDLRLEPGNKKAVVDRYIKKSPALASTWLSNWICQAVLMKRGKLFPVAAPMDDILLVKQTKIDIADSIYILRLASLPAEGGENGNEALEQAVQLTEDLSLKLSNEKLNALSTLFQILVTGELTQTHFYSELREKCGLFANDVMPLLTFIQLPLPPIEREKFLTVEESRSIIQQKLVDELFYFEHVLHNDIFSDNAAVASEPVRVYKEDEFPTFPGSPSTKIRRKVDEDSYTYDMDIAFTYRGDMVYTRKESVKVYRSRKSSFKHFVANAPAYALDKAEIFASSFTTPKPSPNSDGSPIGKGHLAAAGTAAGADPSVQRKVMLDNLPSSITEQQVRHALRKCGPVQRIWLFRDERMSPQEIKEYTSQYYSERYTPKKMSHSAEQGLVPGWEEEKEDSEHLDDNSKKAESEMDGSDAGSLLIFFQ